MRTAIEERSRVATHILAAETAALAAPTAALGRLRRIVRALLLDELRAYRERGVFPKNRDFPGRAVPYFVDADGTRCALAHLLEVGGAAALVDRVARERNNARVRELAGDAELVAWLGAAGISLDEAARIQPEYCEAHVATICGGDYSGNVLAGARGVLEVNVDAGRGTVEAVYGDTLGLRVGDVVRVNASDADARYLVPVHDGDVREGNGGVILVGAGIAIEDDVLKDAGEHALTKAQVVEAVQLSPAECRDRITSTDPYYAESPCDHRRGTGCATASIDADPTTVAILIAVVSAMVRRRASVERPRGQ